MASEDSSAKIVRKGLVVAAARDWIWTDQPVRRAGEQPYSIWTLRDEGGRVLHERRFRHDGAPPEMEDYVLRGEGVLAAFLRPQGTVRHFALDHLGSVRVVSDGSGALLEQRSYEPFGHNPVAPQLDERRQWAGHERDLGDLTSPEDDLDYMQARFYSATLGRFLSVDPAGGDPARPQSWHRYAYVQGNPLNRIDPDGRLANWAVGAIAGGAIGAAGELVRQLVAGKPLNIKDVGAAAAGGVVSGAIAGGTLGASLIANLGVGGAVVAGAVANTAGGVVQRELDSNAATVGLSGEAMLTEAVVGGIGGGTGHTLEQAARTLALGQTRALQASIARRQEIVDSRLARGVPAMSSAEKLARDKASLAAIELRSVTQGTVVGTTTTNAAAPIMLQVIDDAVRP